MRIWGRAEVLQWMFFEQYSHEPYIAVCRFQMVYLGKPASDLDPDKIKRGYAALARMEHELAATRFLVGDAVSLADISLMPYVAGLAMVEAAHLIGDLRHLSRWWAEVSARPSWQRTIAA